MSEELNEIIETNEVPGQDPIEEPSNAEKIFGKQEDILPDEWHLSDNIKGEGEIPEWFNKDKYKTVTEQAKGYNELVKKLGSFTGAPEEYKANLPDDVKEHWDLKTDDPLFETAVEWAKSNNMNQEGFDKLVEMFVTNEIAKHNLMEEQAEKEKKQILGDNPDARIDQIRTYMDKNFAADQLEGVEELLKSPNGVMTMEALIAKTRPGNMSPENYQPAQGMTESKLKEMQFAKDEYGNLKTADPVYRREFEREMRAFYGDEPKVEYIG